LIVSLAKELSKASMYIGNDTGLKHICIALGVKTYTFFGPEPPLEWHPYFYIEGLECRTRDAHFCGLSECESMVCLKDITVESCLFSDSYGNLL
jgi:heptosyltransferase-2